jgi:hypothetical protein
MYMKVSVVTKFYEILRRTTKQFQYADDIALLQYSMTRFLNVT